jgi:hypothetical protein
MSYVFRDRRYSKEYMRYLQREGVHLMYYDTLQGLELYLMFALQSWKNGSGHTDSTVNLIINTWLGKMAEDE